MSSFVNIKNDDNGEECSDPHELDVCAECSFDDFFYDPITYEATCRNCGLVTSFDVGTFVDYVKPKTYFKHNYFTNTILTEAMTRGFKITRRDMVEMERLYKLCVTRFNQTKDVHKRKYFINSNFVLDKIASYMGKDASKFVKLPKANTLKKLEKDWIAINPF
jgi:hypothetical protein